MKNLKRQIEYVLKRIKQSRDNDNILAWIIWANRCPDHVKDIETFKVKFCNNEMPSVESIGRIRRQIQEQNPELRGTKYRERHIKIGKVRSALGY